jgi:predicted nuclease with RNAse H fold
MSSQIIVAGIDVGGRAKGFHCVALRAGAYLDQIASCNVTEVAEWCRQVNAQFIGVDAPCRWSDTGRARCAERDLMAQKIWCFSTPSREAAEKHPKDHFGWMLNGAKLFAQLVEARYPLFNEVHAQIRTQMCFETYPQAVACALAGTIVSAKKKRAIRLDLLNRANIDTSKLTNIDQIDAALCAFTAHQFALGNYKCYGDAMSGFIVVPGTPLTSLCVSQEIGIDDEDCH